MIELQDVAKRYGKQWALRGVSLKIPAGRTLVLIGQSGCGKSTLLRLVMGLAKPDQGRVLVDGTRPQPENVLKLRRRMGYVIQQGGLFPHLTARRNIVLMARHLGWTKPSMQDRISELCRLARLSPELLDRYPVQLSGGQRQRVGLMRALMLDPDILLLDEPLGALDPITRSDLQEDLREIFRQLSKTVVFVTHDLDEAAHFADQTALMHQGRVLQQGAFADLVVHPANDFAARFVQAQRRRWGTEAR